MAEAQCPRCSYPVRLLGYRCPECGTTLRSRMLEVIAMSLVTLLLAAAAWVFTKVHGV
jgi:hypothetical protein